MPQLMPLMWVGSLLMIFLLVLVYMILYSEKIENLMMKELGSDFNVANFMKW